MKINIELKDSIEGDGSFVIKNDEKDLTKVMILTTRKENAGLCHCSVIDIDELRIAISKVDLRTHYHD